jgi:hypothetical protein
MTLGLLNYLAGDKAAALEELGKAKAMGAADFRTAFDAATQRPVYRAISEDKVFLKNLFTEN